MDYTICSTDPDNYNKIRCNLMSPSTTYIVSLISGFYNTVFPIESILDDEDGLQCIRVNSVGFTMSTPILYLISNVVMQNYQLAKSSTYSRNSKNEMRGSKIVMRINNTYVTESPVIVNNANFKTKVLSNDLSMLEFTLVDANMHDIKLLSPKYITVHINAVEDEKILSYLVLEPFFVEVVKAWAKIRGNLSDNPLGSQED